MLPIAAVSVISKIRLRRDRRRRRAARRAISVEQLGVVERARREVDLDASGPARARRAGAIASADHPAVDRVDQPEALGDAEEGARARSARRPRRASAAAARTARSRRCEVEDRLAVERRSGRRSSASRIRYSHAEPRLGLRRVRPASPRVDDAVAARRPWPVVHRAVRVGEQLLAAGAARRPNVRDADARRHADAGARRSAARARAALSSRRLADALRRRRRPARGQQQRELVAAEARQHVVVARRRLRAARATLRSSSSPAPWPKASLTYLKLSRSSISTAPAPP